MMTHGKQFEIEMYQVIKDKVIISDFIINLKDKEILEDPLQSPKSKRVYIDCTISFFHFRGMAVIEKCLFIRCNIISMKVLNKSGKGAESHLKKCIFYGCRIDSLKISRLKDSNEISFINCKIKHLDFKDAAASDTKFIGCEIKHSEFLYSVFPGILFSEFERKKAIVIIKEVINDERTRKRVLDSTRTIPSYKSTVFRSKFLFCELNKVFISNTAFLETAIKHCHLESLKISGDSLMSDADFRGTKMLEPSFGQCEFKNIKFKKGVLIPQLVGGLRGMLTRGRLLLKHLLNLKNRRKRGKSIFRSRDEKELINIIVWRKASKFKQCIKQTIYKTKMIFLVNVLSSTEIKNAKDEKVNLLNDPFFARTLKEFEFINNLKSKHPVFSSFFFFNSNYMRSFARLIFVSLFFIFLFSLLYAHLGTFSDELQGTRAYKYERIDERNHPTDPIYLSVEVFFSGDIYPLTPSNICAKLIIAIEKIFGYGALVTFMSILLAPFATGYIEVNKDEEG